MTSLSSLQAALVLIGGSTGASRSVAFPEPVAPSQVTTGSTDRVRSAADEDGPYVSKEEQARFEAHSNYLRALDERLAAGTLSPLSEEVAQAHASGDLRVDRIGPERPGALDEGWFAVSFQTTAETTAGQAAFVDRHVAMLNAYHYGSDLAKSGDSVAMHENGLAVYRGKVAALDALIAEGGVAGEAAAAYKEQYVQGNSLGLGLANAKDAMERSASMLKAQFGLTASVVARQADGTSAFTGFEVRHETYGLLMSVDADGAMTLYDADGRGYAAADYNAANPGGFIPELENDQVRQREEDALVAARMAALASRA